MGWDPRSGIRKNLLRIQESGSGSRIRIRNTEKGKTFHKLNKHKYMAPVPLLYYGIGITQCSPTLMHLEGAGNKLSKERSFGETLFSVLEGC
jgi:hypothetical protein